MLFLLSYSKIAEHLYYKMFIKQQQKIVWGFYYRLALANVHVGLQLETLKLLIRRGKNWTLIKTAAQIKQVNKLTSGESLQLDLGKLKES